MPANKNQHFVPKFLLRQFSSDPSLESKRRWINVYLLKKREFKSEIGIAGQCQRAYFYGKDLEIETMMTQIEGRTKSLLKDLSPENITKLSDSELFDIKTFIYIQYMRTAEAACRMDLLFDAMMKVSIEREAKQAGVDLNKIIVRHSNPQMLNLLCALEALPFLNDLEICFLRNIHGTEFYLSDHPVCSYNQFAERDKLGQRYPSSCGIASKGIQYFIPLSPTICAAIYDPSTYYYGEGKIIDINRKDAWNINILQASNANTCLYVKNDSPDLESLKALAVRNKKAEPQRAVKVWRGNIMDEPDGRKSQLSGFNMPDIRLGIKFSFIRIINQMDYTGYNLGAFPVRSFAQVQRVRRYREQLRLSSAQAAKTSKS